MRLISLFDERLDVVDDTRQNDFTELTMPGSRTHGIAGRALEHGKDSLRQCSLAAENLVDPRIIRVTDRAKFTMLGQRSDTLLLSFSRKRFQLLSLSAAELRVVTFLGRAVNVENSS